MSLTVRSATPGDIPAILLLIETALGYPQDELQASALRLDRILHSSDYTTLVAVQGGAVLGFLGMMRALAYEFEGEYFRIVALAVQKQAQRRGVGSLLLERAERLAQERRAALLIVNSGLSRLPAHAFYEKHGFPKKGYGFSKKLDG